MNPPSDRRSNHGCNPAAATNTASGGSPGRRLWLFGVGLSAAAFSSGGEPANPSRSVVEVPGTNQPLRALGPVAALLQGGEEGFQYPVLG